MKNIIKDNCINPNYQNLLESTMRYDTDFRWCIMIILVKMVRVSW